MYFCTHFTIHANGNCRGKGLESLCRLQRQKKTAKTAKIRPKTGQFLAKIWVKSWDFLVPKSLYIFLAGN